VIRTQETSPGVIREQLHSYALPIIAAGVTIAILYWARVVFITLLVAIVIALILEPFVGLVMRLRLPRTLAVFVVGLIATFGLYLAGLGIWNQVSSLSGEAPAFEEHLTAFITSISDRITGMERASTRIFAPAPKAPSIPLPTPKSGRRGRKELEPPPVIAPLPLGPAAIPEVRIHEERSPVADYVYARLGTVYEFVLMASFVPFLVYFMLSWRDHLYQSFLRFFEGSDRVAAARSLQGVADMARAFVAGNFLIGLLLAALSCVIFAFMRLPYPFLVGVLSGFLSLVPYVGMPLAFMPPVLAALAGGSPTSVILISFAVVLALHLMAMNVLYPILVGARVHLNPLVVTFSLLFWGFLWDAAGLVLAIPITAGIKAVCDNVVALRPFGRLLGD